MSAPSLTVIMLAYGPEEYLGQAVAAVLASRSVDLEVVLVDNGCTTDAVENLAPDPRLSVLSPGTNLGFTGGVNLAARAVRTAYLALVNSDAIVEPDALAVLVEHARDESVGIAGATILLADDQSLVNSAGNPLHVLGLSWAGGMNQPSTDFETVRDVAAASGACLVMRTRLWNDLQGFPEEYFAYFEDMELSWRCWQRGLKVQVHPRARAAHHYEFSRSPLKMYLIERNRWLFLLTCHERRTLGWLALPLLGFELALGLVALLQGWGRQKLAGWRWVLTHRRWIKQRRVFVQSTRTVRDSDLFPLVTDTFDPAQTPLPPAAAPLETILRSYWRLASRSMTRKDNR